MPQELKARLEESSKASNRSLTAEIIARLESTFAKRQAVTDPVAHDALLKNVQKILEAREDDMFRAMEQKLEKIMAPYRGNKDKAS